ncbi:MAG: hypothetical protein WAS73_03795 [Defluviicoccus sp.]
MVYEGSNVTTQAGYARKVGKSRQAIHKATKAGRVVLDGSGKVDESATEAAAETMASAKLREQIARARMAELRAAEAEGRLIDRDATYAVVRGLARAERDALLLLPARDAPAMAAELGVDEHRLRLALEDMLRSHLERPLPRFPGDDAV